MFNSPCKKQLNIEHIRLRIRINTGNDFHYTIFNNVNAVIREIELSQISYIYLSE